MNSHPYDVTLHCTGAWMQVPGSGKREEDGGEEGGWGRGFPNLDRNGGLDSEHSELRGWELMAIPIGGCAAGSQRDGSCRHSTDKPTADP